MDLIGLSAAASVLATFCKQSRIALRWTVALSLMAPAPAAAQLKSDVVTVNVRPGVTMKYLEIASDERAKAAVMLRGARACLQPSGEISTDLSLNFLMRVRERLAREGLLVAALDVASDQMAGLNGDIRLSAGHAQDIVKVIADLRKRHSPPVWLSARAPRRSKEPCWARTPHGFLGVENDDCSVDCTALAHCASRHVSDLRGASGSLPPFSNIDGCGGVMGSVTRWRRPTAGAYEKWKRHDQQPCICSAEGLPPESRRLHVGLLRGRRSC